MKYFTLLLFLLSFVANADIYTWVDENGTRHYSDTKPVNKTPFEEMEAIQADERKPKDDVVLRSFSSPAEVQTAITTAAEELVSIQAIRAKTGTIIVEGKSDDESKLTEFMAKLHDEGVGQAQVVSNESGNFVLEVLNERLNLHAGAVKEAGTS